jgi:hypothetical protein
VKLAEVVGAPDPRLDEVPVAFVELKEGHALDPDDLIAFCRGKIASFKVPRAIYFMTNADWPMSATKVDKTALRKRLNARRRKPVTGKPRPGPARHLAVPAGDHVPVDVLVEQVPESPWTAGVAGPRQNARSHIKCPPGPPPSLR